MDFKKNQTKYNSGDFQPNEQKIKEILNGNAEMLNEYAKEIAEDLLSGMKMTTSQIRKYLDEIQRMPKYDKNRIQLLRPKLAYAVGKSKKGNKIAHFHSIVEASIKHLNESNFKNFKNFVEAIVAYHKYYGGEE